MFKIGTKLYIHNAGNGAIGCNNCTGIVIDLENENEVYMHGLFKEDEGFLIKLDKNDSIWRVHNEGNNNAHYIIIEEKIEEKLNIKKEINNMKTLQIPVKFQKGDIIYTTRQTKLEKNCSVCEGTGRIKYNDKNMRCPECMGTGKITENKNILKVCDDPFVITLTKISVDNNGNITVRYKGNCGFVRLNRAEESLFSSKEEAQLKCDEMNKDRINIRVDDIIIQDSFKESKPSVDKIQNKLEYYKVNNKFEKNIVVDKNNILQDGYINYLICRILGIEVVKAVVE